MTKDKTVTMSRELIREQFEYSVSDRAWFVAGGMVEDDTPEGFVYGDFTTDMCWTCYFEARQIAAPVVERQEPFAWVVVSPDGKEFSELQSSEDYAKDLAHDMDGDLPADHSGGKHEIKGVFTSPPAPVAVDERAEFEHWVMQEAQSRSYSYMGNVLKRDGEGYATTWVDSMWSGFQARACLDKVKELDQ